MPDVCIIWLVGRLITKGFSVDIGKKLIQKHNGEPYRALLVEDKEVSQLLGVNILTQLGCEVDVVRDGREAVSQVANNNYDVVFMDCSMPIMNGYDATEAIRAYEARRNDFKRVPIIALTARVMEGDREKCIRAGMDDYTTKPIRTESVCEMINKWCANYIDYRNQW